MKFLNKKDRQILKMIEIKCKKMINFKIIIKKRIMSSMKNFFKVQIL